MIKDDVYANDAIIHNMFMALWPKVKIVRRMFVSKDIDTMVADCWRREIIRNGIGAGLHPLDIEVSAGRLKR